MGDRKNEEKGVKEPLKLGHVDLLRIRREKLSFSILKKFENIMLINGEKLKRLGVYIQHVEGGT